MKNSKESIWTVSVLPWSIFLVIFVQEASVDN